MLITPTVIVGGVSGSGTKIIASILIACGLNMNEDLNESLDSLLITLLFKRKKILEISNEELTNLLMIYQKSCNLKENKILSNEISLLNELYKDEDIYNNFPKLWFDKRINILLNKDKISYHIKELIINQKKPCLKVNLDGFGWKDTNSYIILDKLYSIYPKMKYIHLIRNGLDIAFGANQNHLLFWGKKYLHINDFNGIYTPYASLKFWCVMNKKIIKLGEQMGPNHFLLLKYEDLCQEPDKYLQILCNFLNIDSKYATCLNSYIEPCTLGKYKQQELKQLDPTDIEYVKLLGFNIN